MSRRRELGDREKLALLDNLVVEEICGTSDEEILKGVSSSELEETRSRIRAAKSAVGKKRMAEAKAAVALGRARPSGPAVDRTRGAASLRSLRASNPRFDQKLTMAARSGGSGQEEDEGSIAEDLAELERWDAESSGKLE